MALILRSLNQIQRCSVTPSLFFRSLSNVFIKPAGKVPTTTTTTTMAPLPSETRVISNIFKSPRDGREYRGLELKNKLKVLLISDPTTDISAAGLSVAAGSMHDPKDLPGLAHFCEHMLFLGTDFSEEVNEYSRYLAEHGGSSNAYTAQDHTCYYFDIAPDSLQGALLRFSRFFIHPLFTVEMTEREVNAVNSEHEKNIPNDAWRMHQLEVELANPNHSYHSFATGNRDTLWNIPQKKSINVRSALLDYYGTHYSANVMNLIILGKESLDELQALAESLFFEVENRGIPLPRWPENPYGPDQVRTRATVTPIKDIRHLKVTFPIPDTSGDYKSLSDGYLSHLIGHEGPGSLLSLLKKHSLVNNLSAGPLVLSRGNAVFKVDMELTVDGLQRVDDIVHYIFQYLNMLRKEGPKAWIWEEILQLNKISFEYQEKMRPQAYVAGLSSELHRLEMPDILSHGIYTAQFKPDKISGILEKMTPDNCLLIVSAQDVRAPENAEHIKEHFYGIEYSKIKIDPELIEKWENCGLHEELKLPTPNAYIPKALDLKPRDKYTGISPRLVKDEGLSRAWFLQDNEFKIPKGVFRVELYSPLAYIDAQHANLNGMFVSAIKDMLVEEVYPAALADLQFSIGNTHYGVELTLKGYDDNISTLMEIILQKVTNFTLTEERFSVLKDYMIRAFKNWEDEQPYSHAIFYIDYLLHKNKIHHSERLAEAEKEGALTLENLNEYVQKFLTNLKFEMLLCGNFTEEDSKELVKLFEKYFAEKGTTPLPSSQIVRNVEVKLPESANLILPTTHKSSVSSCAAVYFQTGTQSDFENVVLELIESIANEPCYNQLRTKEQLGYIVATQLRRSLGTQGLKVIVQSNYHPSHVDSRIHAFLEQFMETLKSMEAEQFQKHVTSLCVKKAEKPKKISERASRLWNEINSQHYNFERQETEIAVLKNVTQKDVIDFYEAHIMSGGKDRRRLGVHVKSRFPQEEPLSPEAIEHISDTKTLSLDEVKEWKTARELYPPVDPSAALSKAKL